MTRQLQPDAAMLAAIEKVARFIETGADEYLAAFAERDVVILENFAPFLFTGPGAVTSWAKQMRDHARDLTGLKHTFGLAQDYAADEAKAFFSLPTHWSGTSNGQPFHEDGGWAFLLVKQRGDWRVKSYGWAVTRLELE